jgi:hypothetical protein
MKDFKAPESDIIKNPIPYKPQMRLVMDEASMCMIAGNSSASKTTSPLMRFGRMQIYVDGQPVDEEKVENNAMYALGSLVGVLRREGVIID